jgi:hypothetical protein
MRIRVFDGSQGFCAIEPVCANQQMSKGKANNKTPFPVNRQCVSRDYQATVALTSLFLVKVFTMQGKGTSANLRRQNAP